MSSESFRSQLQKYRSGGFTEMGRSLLVDSFQDLISSLKSSEDLTAELTSDIEELLKIQESNPSFLQSSGFDLMEPSVNLYLIAGKQIPQIVKDFAAAIAFNSSPKEILIELNALMTYIKLEHEEQPLEMLKNIGEEQKDAFKIVITYYLSVIIQRIAEKDLKITMQELYIYIELLNFEPENTSSVLESDVMSSLFQSIASRSEQIKTNALPEAIKFLMKLIVVYENSNRLLEVKIKVVELLCGLAGNMSGILQCCKGTIDFTEISDALLILSCMSYKGSVECLQLPFVLSGSSRLQILLLNSVKACGSFPDRFIEVFTHTVNHLEDNLAPEVFANTYTASKYTEFFINILDLCGGLLPNNSKKLFWDTLKDIFGKIENLRKVEVAVNILKEYKWDTAKGMIVDWVCSEVIKGNIQAKECFDVVDIVVAEEHSLDSIESLQAALKLHRLLNHEQFRLRETDVFQLYTNRLSEKYRKIYKEFSHAYDLNPNVPKLGLLLVDLQVLTV